jgi:hypothetical protein
VGERRRGWAAWVFPRALLDAHPVLGGLGVVFLVGTAAGYGVVACPSGALTLGLASAASGGFACLAFSDRPGCLGQPLSLLIRASRREGSRRVAPYMWRWGLICSAVAVVSLVAGGGVIDCG